MVSAPPTPHMLFAGTDGPLAYLELKSIGLPQSITAAASRGAVRHWSPRRPAIATERIYIEFTDAPRHMWGWNGGTF